MCLIDTEDKEAGAEKVDQRLWQEHEDFELES